MANILVLMAVLLSGAAICLGTLGDDTWRTVSIACVCLTLGAMLFGIALTL